MSQENRTPTRQFVEIGDAHVLAEAKRDAEDNLLITRSEAVVRRCREKNKCDSCSTRYATRNADPVGKGAKRKKFQPVD